MTVIMHGVKSSPLPITHYMRYPAAETAEKHSRIVEHASRLFRERGFSVSVSEIMNKTGLTHGPFYNHFATKEALVAEALMHVCATALERIDAVPSSDEGKASYLATYLSEAHRDAPGAGCPVASLVQEVARTPVVRGIFSAHLQSTFKTLAAKFPWSSRKQARRDAILAVSAMTGALMLARSVDDEALSCEILQCTLEALS